MSTSRRLPNLIRFLYTQNPFYVISAGLIFYGLYMAFQNGDAAVEHPWWLALALGGYTLVMAVTAYLVIKLGRVWEDARSIVLILVLQFAAISMSFDQLCSTAPWRASGLLSCGLGFAVLITEALLQGLQIRLPALFRGPYYLLLALFFGYPLCVAPRLIPESVGMMAWRIYLFPVAAGLAFLTLLPAVRRGAAYVAKNGTPWPWPWFPWTAFGLLAAVAGVRSYVLTYNFNMMGMGDAFGSYYLVPLLFALLILTTEMAVVVQSRRLLVTLMLLAPGLVVLSMPYGDSYIYWRFLRMFLATVGSPVWITVVALAGFYAVSWLRRLPGAECGLVATLALLTIVGPTTIDRATLTEIQGWPWCVLGGVQLVAGAARRSSLRWALSVACFIAAACLAFRDTPFLMLGGVIPAHGLLASWLLLGWLFQDRFAAVLRGLGLVFVLVGMTLAVAVVDDPVVTPAVRCSYLAALAATTLTYWLATRERWWFGAGAANLASLTTLGMWYSYGILDDRFGARVLTPLSWGLACFLVAVLISAFKGGLGDRLHVRLLALGLRQPDVRSDSPFPEFAPVSQNGGSPMP